MIALAITLLIPILCGLFACAVVIYAVETSPIERFQ